MVSVTELTCSGQIHQVRWKVIFDTRCSGGWVKPSDEYPREGAPGQLYDVEADPYETKNLWDERQDVVRGLAKLLAKYKSQGYSRRRKS
jgi:hypothetical protein